ncbi:MAG: hypothetical protein ACYC6G_02810 [Desulfobaccales bacterium]
MAFPTNLTNAVDGINEVMADHLNNLEAKVGIDGSLVSTSLDYLLKNPGSVDPGHVHSGYQVAGSYITALTGDVAASGPGSAGATIQAGAVNLAKMANLTANSLIGNNTANPATPLALSSSQVKTLLAIAQTDVSGLEEGDSPTFGALIISGTTSIGLRVGSGTPGHSPASNGIYVTGRSEFAGEAYFNASINSTRGKIGGLSGFYIDVNDGYDMFFRESGSTVAMVIKDGGAVAIGTPNPNAAALLHLSSTSRGFLLPVMTTAQRLAISAPPEGLEVYDSTLHCKCFHNGTNWQKVTSTNAD